MSDKTDEQLEEEKYQQLRQAEHVEALEREKAYLTQTGKTERIPQVDAELERLRASGGAKRTRLRGEKA